ncbi:siderophore-iron reductase FhuF [Pseudomonas sp. LJDD11]|nr:siderophore-iron reductase FhuF [Pseudomonas sp. LJDD11]MCQ9425063.1 siderophore-iron reductase FhuF [Pseudomonas sp. LJDD11]
MLHVAAQLQPFMQHIVAEDDQRPLLTLAELLQPQRLEALLLNLYGAHLMPQQRDVLVSQWAKYGFMLVIPPLLVASITQDWHWPLGLERVAVALDERGIPTGVKFLAAGAVLAAPGGDPLQCFADLLDDLLTPLVNALSAYGGVPRTVLWSSVGEALEHCLIRLDAPLAEKGWPLLSQRLKADGRRNPLYQTIVYTPRRQRRSCCLSHRVEWVGRCEYCPLPTGSKPP